MKKFLITISLFGLVFCGISEVVIRAFRLVPDIPERFIDENGIQRYKPGQSGYYTKAKSKWNVNDHGWLGTSEQKKDSTITIIGDSYIENIMNPIECNQGNILKQYFTNYSFFEAGRSGVTFIEAMEISKNLEKEFSPRLQLIYLSHHDFEESVSEKGRYTDRMQISVKSNKLLHAELKAPSLKKILYNIKLLYFLYLKYPVFVNKQNKIEPQIIHTANEEFDKATFSDLLSYCAANYIFDKLIFVLHPNTDMRLVELIRDFGIKIILLDSAKDKPWGLGSHDGHWSCYGHNQVGKQVSYYLSDVLNIEPALSD